MKRRPPSFAERALRAEARRFLRLARKELLQLTGVIAVVCAVEIVLPTPRLLAGLVTGFLVTACVAIIGFAFLLNGDATYLIAGAMGESHTTEELAEAIKQGLIWHAIPNVEVGGRDVDHLVLAPGGVLAIDSKWRIRNADQRWLTWAAGKATTAARFGSSVCRSKGVDYPTDVTPVVVVWGGARRELPDQQEVDGVAVVQRRPPPGVAAAVLPREALPGQR